MPRGCIPREVDAFSLMYFDAKSSNNLIICLYLFLGKKCTIWFDDNSRAAVTIKSLYFFEVCGTVSCFPGGTYDLPLLYFDCKRSILVNREEFLILVFRLDRICVIFSIYLYSLGLYL